MKQGDRIIKIARSPPGEKPEDWVIPEGATATVLCPNRNPLSSPEIDISVWLDEAIKVPPGVFVNRLVTSSMLWKKLDDNDPVSWNWREELNKPVDAVQREYGEVD